jgi:hypothetical protein
MIFCPPPFHQIDRIVEVKVLNDVAFAPRPAQLIQQLGARLDVERC